MTTLGIAIVGCGTVGGGTAALVHARREAIRSRFGVDLVLRHLVDIDHGHVRELELPQTLFRTDLQKALEDPDTQVIVELVGGNTFAKQVLERAFFSGKHVVTANKRLLAENGGDLFVHARSAGVTIGWEASCAGSIPVVELLGPAYGGSRITTIHAILNGTSNYILTRMKQGRATYASALKEAQEHGFAESNPELDVSGMDSAHKLTLLSGLAFGKTFHLADLPVYGIQGISLEDARAGEEMGFSLKLLASAELKAEGCALRVGPAFLEADHPLTNVNGVFNGVMVLGSAFGLQTLVGRGAGAFPTANAVVADLIQLALGMVPRLQLHCEYLPGTAPVSDPVNDGQVIRKWLVILPVQEGVHPHISIAQAGLELESIQKMSGSEGTFYRLMTQGVCLDTLRTILGNNARCYPVFPTPREILRPEF